MCVWCRVWHTLADVVIGEHGITLLHVRAHSTPAALAALSPEDERHTEGNDIADEWAKEGA